MQRRNNPEKIKNLEEIINIIIEKSRCSCTKDLLPSYKDYLLDQNKLYVKEILGRVNIANIRNPDRFLYHLYDYFHQITSLKDIYNLILNNAKHEKCPYCGGINEPNTLDHYLPRSMYAQYSISLINLIPSCTQCNSQCKSTRNMLYIHPYLDDMCIFEEQWIFATIKALDDDNIEICYECIPPNHWNKDIKDKVTTHYLDFELSERYAICAQNELRGKLDTLKVYLKKILLEF